MKKAYPTSSNTVNKQGAAVLLTAAIDFLRLNAIEEDWIVDFTSRYISGNGNKPNVLRFRRMLRAYEDMSMVMSTWYANPQFLDGFGQPLPLSESRGSFC